MKVIDQEGQPGSYPGTIPRVVLSPTGRRKTRAMVAGLSRAQDIWIMVVAVP
jgi:hypothetical protein